MTSKRVSSPSRGSEAPSSNTEWKEPEAIRNRRVRRCLVGVLVAVVASALAIVDLEAPNAAAQTGGHGPAGVSTGTIAPGQECTSAASCPGIGVVVQPQRTTYSALENSCGGGVAYIQTPLGSIRSGSTRTSCPAWAEIRPACGRARGIPGCCIQSSYNLPIERIVLTCQCIRSAWYMLWIGCDQYACLPAGTVPTQAFLSDCLNATICDPDSANDCEIAGY